MTLRPVTDTKRQTEWYEMLVTGKLQEENIGRIPNIYQLNDHLDRKTKEYREELEKWKTTAQ